MGLNSVLGSGAFVSMVVAGTVSLVVSGIADSGPVDRTSFFRDVGFYLLTLMVYHFLPYRLSEAGNEGRTLGSGFGVTLRTRLQ